MTPLFILLNFKNYFEAWNMWSLFI